MARFNVDTPLPGIVRPVILVQAVLTVLVISIPMSSAAAQQSTLTVPSAQQVASRPDSV